MRGNARLSYRVPLGADVPVQALSSRAEPHSLLLQRDGTVGSVFRSLITHATENPAPPPQSNRIARRHRGQIRAPGSQHWYSRCACGQLKCETSQRCWACYRAQWPVPAAGSVKSQVCACGGRKKPGNEFCGACRRVRRTAMAIGPRLARIPRVRVPMYLWLWGRWWRV